MIETKYSSLAEIDPEVVDWYGEVVRTRTIGYDGESAQPITEEYTVIVLNKPSIVTYSDVSRRRGERKSDEVVHTEIANAILYEDFVVNHDGYLTWREEHAYWVENQPTEGVLNEEGELVELLLPEPLRPVIDIQNRRSVYFVIESEYDSNYVTPTGESVITYDDENYITHVELLTVPRDPEEVVNYHRALAKETRHIVEFSDIEVNSKVWQVREADTSRMEKTIETARRTGQESETTMWILADNSVTTTDISELEQVLTEQALRMQRVFAAYALWASGDMLTPFEY